MVFNCSGTETLFWNPRNRLITFFFVLYIAYKISQKHSLFHERIKIFPVAAFTSPPAKLSCHKFPPPPWREVIWKQQLHWALSSTKVTWAKLTESTISPLHCFLLVGVPLTCVRVQVSLIWSNSPPSPWWQPSLLSTHSYLINARL